jgi:hypothetical protein
MYNGDGVTREKEECKITYRWEYFYGIAFAFTLRLEIKKYRGQSVERWTRLPPLTRAQHGGGKIQPITRYLLLPCFFQDNTEVQALSIVIALARMSSLLLCITTTTYRQNTKKDSCIVLLL